MKAMFLFLTLQLVIVVSFANEPQQLTTVRASYREQVEAATAPITARYVEYLEKLKRDLGAKGDLEGAMAVQKELEAVGGASKTTTGSSEGDRIVIWNQNNGGKGDRGTERVNLSLLKGGREVWSKKSIKVEWDAVQQGKAEIPVPSIVADTLRVEVTKAMNDKGGLAEVEFFQGGRNVALGGAVKVSAIWENNPKHTGEMLTDGAQTTFWLTPNGMEGWAEITLKP
jgi:hypothetical protein